MLVMVGEPSRNHCPADLDVGFGGHAVSSSTDRHRGALLVSDLCREMGLHLFRLRFNGVIIAAQEHEGG